MDMNVNSNSSCHVTDENTPVLQIPRGNWTKQMRTFPTHFCEESIKTHFTRHKANKHFQNGYRMFKASKVTKVLLSTGDKKQDGDVEFVFLKCKVQASMTLARKYDVSMKLKFDTGAIVAGYCNCKAGRGGACIHVSALSWLMLDCLRYGRKLIPDDLACTEAKRVWGVPNAKGALQTKHFRNLYFIRHKPGKASENLKQKADKLKSYSCLKSIGSDEDNIKLQERIKNLTMRLKSRGKRRFFCKILEEVNFVPENINCYLQNAIGDPIEDDIDDENERLSLPVKIFDIRNCSKPTMAIVENAISKTPPILKIKLDVAQNLEAQTRSQSNCDMWKSERVERLTASKFSAICKRRKEITPEFLKTIVMGSDLSRNKYTQEGLRNEDAASKKYEDMKGCVKIFLVGFCVNPGLPMLGASPDRLVLDKITGEFGLLEIKTLAKCKLNNVSIERALCDKDATVSFLKIDENGSLFLDKKHAYHYQIQGQLGITGLTWCDIIVDCGDDYPFCERIRFDERFFNEHIVPKLTEFYAQSVVPFLQMKNDNANVPKPKKNTRGKNMV